MRYNVTVTNKATRQIVRLQPQMQVRVVQGINNLADSTTWGDVRKLVNHQYDYRLRVGDYRVLFNLLDGNVEIGNIEVEEVKKRDEHTY